MVAAVEQATLLWSEILTSDVPIRIKVELDIAETTQMMACWPHMSLYAPDNVNFNWYSSALANKLAGVDLDPNPSFYDMTISVSTDAMYDLGIYTLTIQHRSGRLSHKKISKL